MNEKGWELEDIYIDDGVSGTTFDRSSFQRMIKDIKNQRSNMVFTKDLSRLGRNYVKVGEYTGFFFPQHKVRLITVNENIDSDKDNDIAGFLNIVNEHYAKDISRKVKSVKHSHIRKGYFIGSQPSMGYRKQTGDVHKLEIDEGSKDIIKRMFHLYSLGDSARHIADTLNKEGILTPRNYYFHMIGKPNPYTSESGKWGSATIIRMLGNVVYIGHMCQGKRRKTSFKLARE